MIGISVQSENHSSNSTVPGDRDKLARSMTAVFQPRNPVR
jgi:hypothetical protein